ncbi:SDR family oxidoreductase [Planktotalea sp.]|uniref:SDR family oxidoreductase n=1 Tax=Planktotalea sp. TaxID=2029877 RepID=UPI0025F4973F|nr:SDR family oxidoreductase [Planktotalea sp.]
MPTEKTVIITGAGSGIGAAIARVYSQQGAKVCVADLNGEAANSVAQTIGAMAVQCDVRKESDIARLIDDVESKLGPVDIFISNAGLARPEPSHAASAINDDWQMNWEVHVMAHVYAARALLPKMIERGHGHLVNVASAAGLLNQIGDAAYSATKHAAVSFAESLAITHNDDGIDVSVVCPQYVATPLLEMSDKTDVVGSLISASEAAHVIVAGIEAKDFLILPHPQVLDYCKAKGVDHKGWIGGMKGLRRKFLRESKTGKLNEMYKFV